MKWCPPFQKLRSKCLQWPSHQQRNQSNWLRRAFAKYVSKGWTGMKWCCLCRCANMYTTKSAWFNTSRPKLNRASSHCTVPKWLANEKYRTRTWKNVCLKSCTQSTLTSHSSRSSINIKILFGVRRQTVPTHLYILSSTAEIIRNSVVRFVNTATA